jgi:hypothetical protein
MSFDFDAAVVAPFRMRPGLRRLAPGSPQLTPSRPGSRHQREKLAVFGAYSRQALATTEGFDPQPALDVLLAQAAGEHPTALQWNGSTLRVPDLAVQVDRHGRIEPIGRSSFGLGDEAARCLAALPPPWRLAALAALALREDFAIVDATDGCIPWIAAALPSGWAPEHKVGQSFAAVHAPVADNELVVAASDHLLALVTGPHRWERFVWMVTPHPRLHAHPDHVDPQPWRLASGPAAPDRFDRDPIEAGAWFRSERQTFIPLPDQRQALFTILVSVEPLAAAVATPHRAARLRDALATMSPAVLEYRGLQQVRDALVDWLDRRAGGGADTPQPLAPQPHAPHRAGNR